MATIDPPTLARLLTGLASPDPAVRDEGAYAELAGLVGAGDLDEELGQLLDAGTGLLDHPQVQARSFGCLLVAAVVARDAVAGRLVDGAVAVARGRFADWWSVEEELTGWDDERGWLHVLAHGADAVDELGSSRWSSPADVRALIDLVVRRVRRPTSYRVVQDEQSRIAYALIRLLSRDGITGDDVSHLVDGLAAAWRGSTESTGPPPAEVHNAVEVASALHLFVVLGVQGAGPPPGTQAVLETALREIWPWVESDPGQRG